MSHSRKSEIVDQLRVVAILRENLQKTYQTEDQELAEQEKALLTQLAAEENRPAPPIFEPKQRTVQWHDGCQKLSPQRYKLFDALYFAENQMLTLDALETAGWSETEYGIKHGTLKTAVCRLGIDLVNANSPFLIESVLSDGGETMEISDARGVRTVKVRRSLVGYRLVPRVTGSGQALQNST